MIMNVLAIEELRHHILYMVQTNLYHFFMTNKFLFACRHALQKDARFEKCNHCQSLTECIYRDQSSNELCIKKHEYSNVSIHTSSRIEILTIRCKYNCYLNTHYTMDSSQAHLPLDYDDTSDDSYYLSYLLRDDVLDNLNHCRNVKHLNFYTETYIDTIELPVQIISLHTNQAFNLHAKLENLVCTTSMISHFYVYLPYLTSLTITKHEAFRYHIDWSLIPYLRTLYLPIHVPLHICLCKLETLTIPFLNHDDVLPQNLKSLITTFLPSTFKLPSRLRHLVYRGANIDFRLPNRLHTLTCENVIDLNHCNLFSLRSLDWFNVWYECVRLNHYMPHLIKLRIHNIYDINLKKTPRLKSKHIVTQ